MANKTHQTVKVNLSIETIDMVEELSKHFNTNKANILAVGVAALKILKDKSIEPDNEKTYITLENIFNLK